MKIIFIIPYFGKTPGWIDYFIKSCSYNPDYSWLIYGNIKCKNNELKNIKFINADINDFNRLASERLKLSVNIMHPYKICDLKPFFGIIFYDYIKEYDFWGYCDLDMIFGKITNTLKFNKIINYDLITSRKNIISGDFTLYKNNEYTRNLCKKIWNYKKIITDTERLYYIDEKSNYIGTKIKNIFSSNYKTNIFQRIVNSIRYRFYKRIPLKYDITSVIKKEEKIKILRANNVRLDEHYYKKNINNWLIEWNKGILTDHVFNEELIYFHFLKTKYYIKTSEISKNQKFIINENSIYINHDNGNV